MRRGKEFTAWIARYDNPMKDVVQHIRTIILETHRGKHQGAGTAFSYRGNLAGFYPKSRQHASLMFHLGAKIPGKHPRLEGSGTMSRVMKIESAREADNPPRRAALR